MRLLPLFAVSIFGLCAADSLDIDFYSPEKGKLPIDVGPRAYKPFKGLYTPQVGVYQPNLHIPNKGLLDDYNLLQGIHSSQVVFHGPSKGTHIPKKGVLGNYKYLKGIYKPQVLVQPSTGIHVPKKGVLGDYKYLKGIYKPQVLGRGPGIGIHIPKKGILGDYKPLKGIYKPQVGVHKTNKGLYLPKKGYTDDYNPLDPYKLHKGVYLPKKGGIRDYKPLDPYKPSHRVGIHQPGIYLPKGDTGDYKTLKRTYKKTGVYLPDKGIKGEYQPYKIGPHQPHKRVYPSPIGPHQPHKRVYPSPKGVYYPQKGIYKPFKGKNKIGHVQSYGFIGSSDISPILSDALSVDPQVSLESQGFHLIGTGAQSYGVGSVSISTQPQHYVFNSGPLFKSSVDYLPEIQYTNTPISSVNILNGDLPDGTGLFDSYLPLQHTVIGSGSNLLYNSVGSGLYGDDDLHLKGYYKPKYYKSKQTIPYSNAYAY